MTTICDDEIDNAAAGEELVAHTGAVGDSVPSPEPTAVDEKKGSKRRKATKQPTAKHETQGDSDPGSGVQAVVATPPTSKKPGDQQASKLMLSEQHGAAKGVLASYPNLAAWPTSAGPAPLPAHILTARALGMGPGTKRELAVAAYLRADAGQFTLIQVAEALRAVLGGEFNVQRNVVKTLEADGLVKVNKVITEGTGTSLHLELTAAGETRVREWLAAHGHGEGSRAAELN